MKISLLLLLIMVILTSLGQIFVKKGSLKIVVDNGIKKLLVSFFNLPLIIGGLCILGAPLFYFTALKNVPLILGYSFSALSYPLVLLGAMIFLKEKLNRWHWIGIVSIGSGLILWQI